MYYFIVNPASGSGRGQAVWKTIEEELKQLGISYRAFLLAGPGEAAKLAEGLSNPTAPITLVAVGGDGTINEIINGLSSFENITFACIPTGSGNDFVRGLDLERDPLKALHVILHPERIEKINIGQVSCDTLSAPHAFAVSSGFGYDAAVCDLVQRSKVKKILNFFHWGKLAYLVTALWLLLTMKRRTVTVSADGQKDVTFRNAYFAAAMNLRYEGGGFMFCPDAHFSDDMLDLIIAYDISRLRALMLLPLALFGKHVGRSGIHILRCHEVSVTASDTFCVHTDGEIPCFAKRATFGIHKEKLAVILR